MSLRRLAVVAVLLFTPALARAQSPAELKEARDLFAKAEKDEAKQDWSAALEELQKAATIKSTPGIRFHIALCEESLGRHVEALTDYLAAEQQARAENNKEVLQALVDPLNELRARVPTLKIVVPQEVAASAEVKLDGATLPREKWGTLLPLETGTHTIAATAPNRAPFSTTVEAKERESTILDVKLAPAAAPAAPAATTTTTPEPAKLVEPPREEPRGTSRTGAVLATGGTIVLAVGGIGAYALAGSAQSDGRDTCAHGGPCDEKRSAIRTWDGVALGAWIGAAACGALAIVLWTRPSSASTTRVSATGNGVRFEGSF